MYYQTDGGVNSANDCYTHFSEYFETGYFAAGYQNQLSPWTPTTAVIDLTTGKLLHVDTIFNSLGTAADIIEVVDQVTP